MTDFPKWLEGQLAVRGWKQIDLARASGVSSALISNILNGNRNAGEKSARKFAEALGLPPETVFREAGILPVTDPNKELDFLGRFMFKMLNEENQEKAIEYIKYLKVQEEKTKDKPKNIKKTIVAEP